MNIADKAVDATAVTAAQPRAPQAWNAAAAQKRQLRKEGVRSPGHGKISSTEEDQDLRQTVLHDPAYQHE